MGVHDGHRDRMRERFLLEGPDGLADHELLEMLLYGTIPRGNTNEVAHSLLDEFGSFTNLIESDPHEITKTAGVGEKSAIFLSLLHELVRRYENEKLEEKSALTSISRCADYCMTLLRFCATERFYVICLDSRRRVIHTAKVSEGTVGHAHVPIRTVVEKALRYNATGIVLCHNHPRGNVRPSNDDIHLTSELKKALLPLGIEVVEHIIVGDHQYFSFFENDLLKGEG